jgi:predicted dehydrogenase
MEDNASVLMKLDNGGSATLRIDFLQPQSAPTHGDDRLRFAGSNGVLDVRGAEEQIIVITADKGVWKPLLPPKKDLFRMFVASLDGESESPVPAEDCYRATEICLLAREAQDTGKIVRLVR